MASLSPRLRHWLDQLLHTHDTPKRTAAAFALGVFFGFSPLLGLHTVLGLVCAFALNLNRVAVLLGVYSNLPWILPAYYTLTTMAGAALLQVEIKPSLLGELTAAVGDASMADVRKLAHGLAPVAWSFALGSTLGAILLALVAYRVSLTMIIAHRRRTVNQ
jgi:uncharacterized protein (DUF2062 family)